jgi:dipeptidyl aminopeptidase/acylaminoacyl peptidase
MSRRLSPEYQTMDALTHCLDALERLQHPSDLSFRQDGMAIAATISPASHEPNKSYESRLWRFDLAPGKAGGATQLTFGPGSDALCRYSPRDNRLAFASDRDLAGKMSLFLLGADDTQASPRPVGDIPGTVEDIRWNADATALISLAADRGMDAAATSGARRLAWGEEEDPAVTNPAFARRRLFRVSLADGTTAEIGPANYTVWEFDLLGNEGAIAVVSTDPSERGWYHAKLARLDFTSRTAELIYAPSWQIQGAAVDRSARRVAFLESWSSDRGLVAGEIRLLDLESERVASIAPDKLTNITSVQWRDDQSLWFAGWDRLGAVHGIVGSDGRLESMDHDEAVIGTTSFLASITPSPQGEGFAAVREAEGQAPEIARKTKTGAAWQRLTSLNGAVEQSFPGYPEVRAVSWKGQDGLVLEGLLMLPGDRPPGPLPMIVDIHGGPSWAAKHAFNPGYALPHTAAGYAVFLPNYRGNVGWGQEFARMNIGDPGGAEFQGILAGIDWCIAQGIARPGHIGVTGVSYGGYMTAWAVATTNRFQAAVMISGICDNISSHYSCNHDFSAFIAGGPLTQKRYRDVALDRSPLLRLDRPVTPTLILHGALDRCTPLGQAQEFHAGLLERGCVSELVVYPREGHGFREDKHRRDSWRRAVAWFDRYLKAA